MILYTDLFRNENFDEVRLVKKDDCKCSRCESPMVKNGSTEFNFNKDIGYSKNSFEMRLI